MHSRRWLPCSVQVLHSCLEQATNLLTEEAVSMGRK